MEDLQRDRRFVIAIAIFCVAFGAFAFALVKDDDSNSIVWQLGIPAFTVATAAFVYCVMRISKNLFNS